MFTENQLRVMLAAVSVALSLLQGDDDDVSDLLDAKKILERELR